MIVPAIYRLEITQGPTPGSLQATPRLESEAGEVLEMGEAAPLTAGQHLSFGPFKMEMHHDAQFNCGGTEEGASKRNDQAQPQQPEKARALPVGHRGRQ